MSRTVILSYLAVGLLLAIAGASSCAGAGGGFVLRDFIGRTWRNERVSFPLTAAQAAQARAGHALLGPDGKPVLYQLLPGATPPQSRIEFLADLNPYETREYSFAAKTVKVPTDLVVEETPDHLQLSNSQVAIAIPRQLAAGAGPIARLRLPSGKMVGGSALQGKAAVTAYTATVTARGPVFAEVTCRTTFGDQGTWEISFQLQAGDPTLRVAENSAVRGDEQFVLFPNRDLNADKILYRRGKGQINQNEIGDLTPGEVCVLEPWCRWWERDRQGPCFTLFNSAGPDALAFGAAFAGTWVNPDLPPDEPQAFPQIMVNQGDAGMTMTFPLQFGQRRWLITGLKKDDALAGFKGDQQLSLLPYQYLIKHGQFPLDLVKDYTLAWPGENVEHPRLLITPADVARFRQSIKDMTLYTKAIPGYLQAPPATINTDGPIAAYLATGEPALGKYLGDCAEAQLDATIRRIVDQPDMPFGAAPHNFQSIGSSVLLADTALSCPQLDPVLRERILGQIAFLGYTVNRPDYWSPERGFAANPNMTTSVEGYRTTIGWALPSHPLAKAWQKAGMDHLQAILDDWSDANGGWLEAPHYAIASSDQILACFVMARNAGDGSYLYQPKLHKFLDWFSKISTPPDSRIKGWRHVPPIGNTYLQEPTSQFGTVAYLFRDHDPAWSAQMEWMWHQQGDYPQPVIGGSCPGFAGYRDLLLDPTLPATPPPWKSELFPETGVVLRNVYNSPRETYLHLIAGSNHAHYDYDSGSVVLWGKGRIIADDFGYYGRAPLDDHNMLDTPLGGQGEGMRVQDFSPGPRLDYVNAAVNGWRRQIAFVKDADPLGPNYFLINDTLAVPAPATWRLWCTATQVQAQPGRALVVGKEDVDTDVIFADPPALPLTTEDKTRTSASGMYPNNRGWGPMASTQIGLIAQQDRAQRYLAVIYPRLKTDPPPTVTPLAGGQGVKVESPAGTDYVFLSAAPFTYQQDDVTFSGTVGLAQIRAGQPLLSLGAPGKITARGKTLEQGAVTSAATPNSLPGDFADGKLDGWQPDSGDYGVTAGIFPGNPAPPDPTHQDKYCLKLQTRGKDQRMSSFSSPLYLDPTKTYKVSFDYYTTAKMRLQYGGYGTDSHGQAKDAQGRVWEWGSVIQGPTDKWQHTQTTLGPPGSGAQFTYLPAMFAMGFSFRIWGDENLTLYVDDLRFEEVR